MDGLQGVASSNPAVPTNAINGLAARAASPFLLNQPSGNAGRNRVAHRVWPRADADGGARSLGGAWVKQIATQRKIVAAKIPHSH